jgi:hypothetical protein
MPKTAQLKKHSSSKPKTSVPSTLKILMNYALSQASSASPMETTTNSNDVHAPTDTTPSQNTPTSTPSESGHTVNPTDATSKSGSVLPPTTPAKSGIIKVTPTNKTLLQKVSNNPFLGEADSVKTFYAVTDLPAETDGDNSANREAEMGDTSVAGDSEGPSADAV